MNNGKTLRLRSLTFVLAGLLVLTHAGMPLNVSAVAARLQDEVGSKPPRSRSTHWQGSVLSSIGSRTTEAVSTALRL